MSSIQQKILDSPSIVVHAFEDLKACFNRESPEGCSEDIRLACTVLIVCMFIHFMWMEFKSNKASAEEDLPSAEVETKTSSDCKEGEMGDGKKLDDSTPNDLAAPPMAEADGNVKAPEIRRDDTS